MANEEIKMGVASAPRFEFRSFGRDFSEVAGRMARLSVPVPEAVRERKSEEIYIVSRSNDVNNTKIRAGKMDIKVYLRSVQGLEQWDPLMKAGFPVGASMLEDEVFPAFHVDTPFLDKESYTLAEFLGMVEAHPVLEGVSVEKQRFGYMVNNTICEVANVLIGGVGVVTVSSESTSIEDVRETIADLGLSGVENINYLQAIKRVIGMVARPLAN
jgi:hypothetical protein